VPGQLKVKSSLSLLEAATASWSRIFSHADQAGATARRFSQWRQVVTRGEGFDSKGQPYWQPPLPAPRQIFTENDADRSRDDGNCGYASREDGANLAIASLVKPALPKG